MLWFFCFVPLVKLKPLRRAPVLIVFGVLLFVILLRLLQLDPIERVERMTFDMRARAAVRQSGLIATNLGFVFIDEESVRRVWNRSLGFSYGLFWPRSVYGRLIDELSHQGAKAVALDVIFGELRPDHASVQLNNNNLVDSDQFFAEQMKKAGNTILALTTDKLPPALFRTNALALADITTEKDPDGILRRVKVFRTYNDEWHPIFRQLESEYGVDLNQVKIDPDRVVFRTRDGEEKQLELDKHGTFDVADFLGNKIPPGMARRAKPCAQKRVWHMGIVLAAIELDLNLSNAEVDLDGGRITLQGPGNVERVIPVDAKGYFYVDWCIPPNHPLLATEPIQELLLQNKHRLEGQTEGLTNRWQGKLAVVGSSAVVGNNLTDVGATPLSEHTLLVGKHWNVANSIITGRFIRRANLAAETSLITLLGFCVAGLSWRSRIVRALIYLVLLCVAYVIAAFIVFNQTRFWIPIALPLLCGLLTFVSLLSWRLIFEEAERRRIKVVFGTVVSPKILDVLLETPHLALGGTRRQITIMFADVRGFTELTDTSQAKVAEYVRSKNLTGAAAETRFNEQARETLATVNLYLGIVADTILKQDATLDKFIGDCVMAFWGAPAAQPRHASLCVCAAVEAQRAIYELNINRAIENQKLELENLARISAGLEPKPMLPILLLGTGINTGMATIGLMGSGSKQKNYTVFGREVNLASRLEGLSGRGRIFISESTYRELVRDDSVLAGTCLVQPPARVKGISGEIIVYEVPWRPPGAPEQNFETETTKTSDATAITSIIQRA